MFKAIKYNLSHVFDFTGRDARQTFWFYVLFLVVAQFVIGTITSIPMYISIVSQTVEAATTGGAEGVDMTDMVDAMIDQMNIQVMVSTVLGVILIALLACSFVRRLHDAGFTGWIAVLPITAHLFSMAYTYASFDRMEEIIRRSMPGPDGIPAMDPFAAQAEMGVLGLVGWVGTMVVIGFGVLKSQDGPNKYGDSPVSF